jgi:hypothetical protein
MEAMERHRAMLRLRKKIRIREEVNEDHSQKNQG